MSNAICEMSARRSRGRRHVHKDMGLKQGRAPRPAEKDRGSKVAERAEEAEFGERREPGGWVRSSDEAG